MKVVCALVCLTLAHGITGSIFEHVDRREGGVDIKKRVYIDQNQTPQYDQSSEDQRQWDHTLQNKKYRNQPQSQKLLDMQVMIQKHWDQPAQEQKPHDQHLQNQKYWDQPTQEQKQQYGEYQSSYYPEQEQLSTHKYPQQSHNRHQEKTRRQSSSSESSQDSKEKNYYDNQQSTLLDDSQRWNLPVVSSVMNKDGQNVQAYGDAIVWNGIQMAVGPNAPVLNQDDIENIFGDAQKAMKHIQEEDKVKFHEVYEVSKLEANEDALLNATQLVQKHQYPVEEHIVKTDDGYVLTIFRIPPKQQVRDVQKKPVAFLMHSIMGSADDWLLMGTGKSLAFMLSDAGFDVWLGNARGNKYSRRHVSKHPAQSDFWQYSTDEIALHDLPVMIDYALETTKQEKLYYIGHGQGTTAFFALTATRPEYNDRINMMFALSPMAYMTNVRSPLFRMIAPTSKFHERLQHQFGNGAFTPSKEMIHTVGGAMCENEIGCKKVCSNVNFVMAGVNVDGMDPNIIPVVLGHLPAGTSTKVIKQYGQGVASHEFRRYDYGSEINEQVYGKSEPPNYNMAEVQVPVVLYYSEEDWLAHPEDVIRLQQELPNVSETYKVPEKHFSHLDFQFSTKAPEMVYTRIIESMQNNQ